MVSSRRNIINISFRVAIHVEVYTCIMMMSSYMYVVHLDFTYILLQYIQNKIQQLVLHHWSPDFQSQPHESSKQDGIIRIDTLTDRR